jgi:Zn finger protein HypA/HybF involved in hydrogenase expression
MAALSWDEICKRAEDNNKTVICEVEKSYDRRFLVRCLSCLNESIVLLKHLSYSKTCRKCYHLSESKEKALLRAKECNVELLSYMGIRSDNHHQWSIKCNKCNSVKNSIIRDFGGCKICRANNQRSSKEEFVEKAKLVHGEKFNYDFIEYVNSITKVKIFCKVCEDFFLQPPGQHLQGYGCLACSGYKKYSNEEFSKKAIEIHGDKYCYNLVDYINTEEKVKIKCLECDEIFLQRPHNHLAGQGCANCAYKNRSLSTDDFIFKAKQVHGEKFSYDSVNYQHNDIEVDIKCNKCNFYFKQKPHSHLGGKGCPKCNESKGEINVAKYLDSKGILYIRQKKFDDLKDKKHLKLDFYLPKLKYIIEYDGHGHYLACFGSTPEEKQKNLEDCQRRDKIKNEWALRNNIPLLRIPYWDFDRIEELIEAFIFEHTVKREVKQLVLEM